MVSYSMEDNFLSLDEIINGSEINIFNYSNASLNTTSNSINLEEPSLLYIIVVSFFLSAIDVTTLVGNLLVVIAVYTTKSLNTVTNSFIVSLAVADMLVSVLVLPLSIYMVIWNNWKFGMLGCDLWIG